MAEQPKVLGHQSTVAAGPARPRLTAEQREEKKQEALGALWRAIWEASQLCALVELEQYCLGVVEEIRSDEP